MATPPAAKGLRARRRPSLDAVRSRLELQLLASPAFLPALGGVAVLVWFASDEGGFEPTTWLAGGLLLLALLAIALIALPRPRPPRVALVAIGLLAAYAAWSYLSMLWADDPWVAWDGANRTVLYAVVLALFLLWPMRAQAAGVLLGAWALGVTVIGLVELLRAEGASSSLAFFEQGRLEEPTGYINANVALWTSALWPCVILAGRREVPAGLRGVFLASAGLLTALAILGQSRAWLLVLPAMVALAIALVPGRGRTIAALAAVGLAALVMLDPLLEVLDRFDPEGPPGPALSDAVRMALPVCAVLGAIGWAAAVLDSRVTLSPRLARRVGAGLVAAVVAAAVGAVAAYAVVERSPVTAASDAWHTFKQGEEEPEFEGTRLGGSVSSKRYDYWRVAWEDFKREPIVGTGADNYLRSYLLRGRTDQAPTYPHSVALRALGQTGLIGALVLAGALAAGVLGALPALRRGGGLAGPVAGAALLVLAYWLLHGSVDWLWEFPALGGAGFAALGLAGAVAASRSPASGAPLPGGRLATLAVTGAGMVLLVGMALPWLSEREFRRGVRLAGSDPAGAVRHLDRARRLNPLTPRPEQTAALIAVRQRQLGVARARFRDALERDEDAAFTYLQLGAIASVEGQRGEAARLVGRALRLSPRSTVVREAATILREGKILRPERVNALALSDIRSRVGPE